MMSQMYDVMTSSDVSGGKLQINVFRGGSTTAATTKTKLFVIIVNSFQPLTIITKCSILDVAAVLDPPLVVKLVNRWKW